MLEPSLHTKTHRVLIIDDEKVISFTLATVFNTHGYDARGVLSAELAMDMIESWPPHLAIIDVCLPGMNGVDFAIHMSTFHSACHLLMLSGQPDSADLLDAAAKMGFPLEILAKPIHPKTLLARAAELLTNNGLQA